METAMPLQKHYKLKHFHQRFNWDCGISCILMVLNATQREEFLKNFDKICEAESFGNSTWTIDLCYLLKRFKIHHDYFTKTLGIDPTYSNNSYYQKIINKDAVRVTCKFKEAAANDLCVAQRTVRMDYILTHLAKKGPVILLTNSTFLICSICKSKVLEQVGCLSFVCCFLHHKRTPKSYAGHYVVLCGYDQKQKRLYYRNPEVSDGHICHCSISDMDTARKAYGTDEDAIFIYQS